MNAISTRFAIENVGSIFLYTHEAHPGEYYPYLTSIDQKLRHARDLRDKLGVQRPILLDSMDGSCHRAYGSMRNMTWIFAKSGIPIYQSDWTDATSVENAMEYFLGVLSRRHLGGRMVPFQVERIDFKTRDMEGFYRALEQNGTKAAREFRAAFP